MSIIKKLSSLFGGTAKTTPAEVADATEPIKEETKPVEKEEVQVAESGPVPSTPHDVDPMALQEMLASMRAQSYEFMKTLPLWMKCNLVSRSISSLLAEGKTEEEANTEVDWDKVNELLHSSSVKYDYNLFGRIESISDMVTLRGDVIMASVMEDMPFHQRRCRQCGQYFTLSLGQLHWYENKGLKVPCRCEYCRKGTARSTPRPVATTSTYIPEKTNMQLALEKAGFHK